MIDKKEQDGNKKKETKANGFERGIGYAFLSFCSFKLIKSL